MSKFEDFVNKVYKTLNEQQAPNEQQAQNQSNQSNQSNNNIQNLKNDIINKSTTGLIELYNQFKKIDPKNNVGLFLNAIADFAETKNPDIGKDIKNWKYTKTTTEETPSSAANTSEQSPATPSNQSKNSQIPIAGGRYSK